MSGPVFAIPRLYRAVKERFAEDGLAVVNLFGWRTPHQRVVTGPRICWVPGDEQGGMGELGPAKYPGGNPRSLATLQELFTITIYAADTTDIDNELAQYEAVRVIFDAWYRAAYLAAYGTFTVQDTSWVTDKNDRRYGAAMRALVAIDAKIPDQKYTDANVGVDVVVDHATQVGAPNEDGTFDPYATDTDEIAGVPDAPEDEET